MATPDNKPKLTCFNSNSYHTSPLHALWTFDAMHRLHACTCFEGLSHMRFNSCACRQHGNRAATPERVKFCQPGLVSNGYCLHSGPCKALLALAAISSSKSPLHACRQCKCRLSAMPHRHQTRDQQQPLTCRQLQ